MKYLILLVAVFLCVLELDFVVCESESEKGKSRLD